MVAQILVIILLSASEFTVTPCHMTKQNAVKIKKTWLIRWFIVFQPCTCTHTHSHTFDDSFRIQPTRNAIRNLPQKQIQRGARVSVCIDGAVECLDTCHRRWHSGVEQCTLRLAFYGIDTVWRITHLKWWGRCITAPLSNCIIGVCVEHFSNEMTNNNTTSITAIEHHNATATNLNAVSIFEHLPIIFARSNDISFRRKVVFFLRF